MKIGIITHGIPNLFSEGTTKEAIILIEELKKKISTKLFILNYSKIFASSSSKNKLLKSIKNYDYEIIKENETSFFKKL